MDRLKQHGSSHSRLPPPNVHHSYLQSPCWVSFSGSPSIVTWVLSHFCAMVSSLEWQILWIFCQDTVLIVQNKVSSITKEAVQLNYGSQNSQK